jgi:hypothetical protein
MNPIGTVQHPKKSAAKMWSLQILPPLLLFLPLCSLSAVTILEFPLWHVAAALGIMSAVSLVWKLLKRAGGLCRPALTLAVLVVGLWLTRLSADMANREAAVFALSIQERVDSRPTTPEGWTAFGDTHCRKFSSSPVRYPMWYEPHHHHPHPREEFSVKVIHDHNTRIEFVGGSGRELTASRLTFHTILGGAGPRKTVAPISISSLGIE